jgi:hypothetical protein
VKDVDIHAIGLWRSIHSKERMDEFIHFQDSQNRGALMAESADGAHIRRSWGEWGLGITNLAMDQSWSCGVPAGAALPNS